MSAVETAGSECSVHFRNRENIDKAASVFNGSKINEKESKEHDFPPYVSIFNSCTVSDVISW